MYKYICHFSIFGWFGLCCLLIMWIQKVAMKGKDVRHLERMLLNWNSTRGLTMSKNSFIFCQFCYIARTVRMGKN